MTAFVASRNSKNLLRQDGLLWFSLISPRIVVVFAVRPSLKRDKWRRTPLHRAAKEGHKDVVEALINAGAEINAQVGCDTVRTCARWEDDTDRERVDVLYLGSVTDKGRYWMDMINSPGSVG